MTDHDDRDDSRLAATLRAALEERDRVVRPPRFATMWSERRARRRTALSWRPVAASAICALVVAGIVWKSTDHPAAAIDPSLAHRLSSADYWRVPTDELLAYEAAPLHADLPTPSGLQISLEESVL
jgi:hypothetical protein